MSYEFLAHYALDANEASIKEVVQGKGKYQYLSKATWTAKSQVLFTGSAIPDKSYETSLKNDKHKGYPAVVEQNSSIQLADTWESLLLPDFGLVDLLPKGSCLIRIDIVLETPFYSRDDLMTYPIENPLKREWVFGVPYLGASGVKGLVRWAYRMCGQQNEDNCETSLFGPRKEALKEENAQKGSLYFYPLFWSGKVGFEVINPHDRRKGTGIRPIKYEVVSRGGKTSLFLMLINRTEDLDFSVRAINELGPALAFLLENTGISARRSSGWGAVKIEKCSAWLKMPGGHLVDNHTNDAGDSEETINWQDLTDEDGNLRPLTPDNGFTTARIATLTGWSKTQVKKNKEAAFDKLRQLWQDQKDEASAEAEETSEKSEFHHAQITTESIPEMIQSLMSNLMYLRDLQQEPAEE